MHDAEQGEQEPRPTGFDDTLWAAEDFAAHAQSLIAAPRLPSIHCAWCAKEGMPSLIRSGNPDVAPSHGICGHHSQILFENAGLCGDGDEDGTA